MTRPANLTRYQIDVLELIQSQKQAYPPTLSHLLWSRWLDKQREKPRPIYIGLALVHFVVETTSLATLPPPKLIKTLKALEAIGYIQHRPERDDERQKRLESTVHVTTARKQQRQLYTLTPAGRLAMAATT